MDAEEHGPDSGAAVRAAARAGDFDRYLAALLAPAERCDDLMTLAAFFGEIARVPSSVREPMMGEIRLQWWREVVSRSAQQRPTGNPVADAIAELTGRRGVDRAPLLDMIEARSFDLYPDPMPNETAFRGYLAKTEGAAFRLGAQILGMAPGPSLDDLIEAAGFALGAIRVLQALPQTASRGRMHLPVTRIAAAGADLDGMLAGRMSPAVGKLVADLAADTRTSLQVARPLLATLSRAQRAAFLPLALIEPHLRALEAPGLDALRTVASLSPLARIGRLWWAHATGRA